jgi:hypothetical protein
MRDNRMIKVLPATPVLLAVFLSASNARADYDMSTQGLLRMCRANQASVESVSCVSYISGIAEYMRVIGMYNKDTIFGICGTPTSSAMLKAFLKWGEENPNNSDLTRAVAVQAALHGTWPCREKSD